MLPSSVESTILARSTERRSVRCSRLSCPDIPAGQRPGFGGLRFLCTRSIRISAVQTIGHPGLRGRSDLLDGLRWARY